MKTIYLLACLILSVSCNSQTTKKTNQLSPDFNVALNFINDYVIFCTKKEPMPSDKDWIEGNQLLTKDFKNTYKRLLDSAHIADPGMGLGFDPIFDAQDFDSQGFSIVSVDTNTGYVTVMGNHWKEFTLVLKVVNHNGKWLVDGSGVINIPNEKRAKRE